MGLLDILFDPDGFFEVEVGEKKPIYRGLTVVLLAAFLSAVISSITSPAMAKAIYHAMLSKGVSPEMAKTIASTVKLSVVLSPLIVIFSWLLVSAILYGISALFGGEGNFSDTLKVVAYSFIPDIVVFPFSLYIAIQEAKALETLSLSSLSGFRDATVILNLAVLAWQFMLWRYGIKHARKLSSRDATIVAGILTIVLVALTLYGLFNHKNF